MASCSGGLEIYDAKTADNVTRFGVRVTLFNKANGKTEYSIWRRYRDFNLLDTKLRQMFRRDQLPVLPSKTLKKSFEDAFIERRRIRLQQYLDDIYGVSYLRNSPQLRAFLDITKQLIIPTQLLMSYPSNLTIPEHAIRSDYDFYPPILFLSRWYLLTASARRSSFGKKKRKRKRSALFSFKPKPQLMCGALQIWRLRDQTERSTFDNRSVRFSIPVDELKESSIIESPSGVPVVPTALQPVNTIPTEFHPCYMLFHSGRSQLFLGTALGQIHRYNITFGANGEPAQLIASGSLPSPYERKIIAMEIFDEILLVCTDASVSCFSLNDLTLIESLDVKRLVRTMFVYEDMLFLSYREKLNSQIDLRRLARVPLEWPLLVDGRQPNKLEMRTNRGRLRFRARRNVQRQFNPELVGRCCFDHHNRRLFCVKGRLVSIWNVEGDSVKLIKRWREPTKLMNEVTAVCYLDIYQTLCLGGNSGFLNFFNVDGECTFLYQVGLFPILSLRWVDCSAQLAVMTAHEVILLSLKFSLNRKHNKTTISIFDGVFLSMLRFSTVRGKMGLVRNSIDLGEILVDTASPEKPPPQPLKFGTGHKRSQTLKTGKTSTSNLQRGHMKTCSTIISRSAPSDWSLLDKYTDDIKTDGLAKPNVSNTSWITLDSSSEFSSRKFSPTCVYKGNFVSDGELYQGDDMIIDDDVKNSEDSWDNDADSFWNSPVRRQELDLEFKEARL